MADQAPSISEHLTTPKHALTQDTRSIDDRVSNDIAVRANMRPRTPPTPTITFSSANTPSILAAVTFSPVRKDMDYIIRWKLSTDANYAYSRVKTSPANIYPVQSGKTLNFALAQEWRATGARSGFTTDTVSSSP